MGSFFRADCLTHEKCENLTPSKFTNHTVAIYSILQCVCIIILNVLSTLCSPIHVSRNSTASSSPPSLSRLIHTRMAHTRTSRSVDTSGDRPPVSGVVLTPTPCVGGGCDTGEGAESDMDASDQDEPSRSNAPMDSHSFNLSVHSIPTQPFSFLDIDSDQSDDDEFPSLPGMMYQFEGDATAQSEESDEERLEDIYPYAWALDGRRIGETSSNSNHQNVMANISLVSNPTRTKYL